MGETGQAGKTAVKVIAYVFIVLLVAGIVGVVVHFTSGFKTEFKTFYVTVDGPDVMTSAGGYIATPEQPLTVEVKYIFDSGESGGNEYSVKVIPNAAGKDFGYMLDGEIRSYLAEPDLTAGFDIARAETSFTLRPKGDLRTVLEAAHPSSAVEDCDGKSNEDMYALVVTSYNGEASVTLYFSVPGKVTGVEFGQDELWF